jgi:microcystin-dependent protein
MDNFLGEIRMFGGNFAPLNWAFCAGQTLPISSYTALFSLIGTTYGGDGVQTFQLPDLRGRLPVGEGQGTGLSNYFMGEAGGLEGVTLTQQQIPMHNHVPNATTANGSVSSPGNTVVVAVPVAATGKAELYAVPAAGKTPPTPVALSNLAVAPDGGGAAHSNLMPTLCVNYIIALEGIFPSRN